MKVSIFGVIYSTPACRVTSESGKKIKSNSNKKRRENWTGEATGNMIIFTLSSEAKIGKII